MALIPDPNWTIPAVAWPEVVNRYVHFRRVKAWRGRTHNNEGVANPSGWTKGEALKIRGTLEHQVDALLKAGVLRDKAHPISQRSIECVLTHLSMSHRSLGRSPAWLQHLWRAILLNRDGYSCQYCGRTAREAHKQLGATLRFELDHRRAKSLLGARRDDFDLRNIVIACRSCNIIKGQMHSRRFLAELASLGRAALKKHRS